MKRVLILVVSFMLLAIPALAPAIEAQRADMRSGEASIQLVSRDHGRHHFKRHHFGRHNHWRGHHYRDFRPYSYRYSHRYYRDYYPVDRFGFYGSFPLGGYYSPYGYFYYRW